MDLRGWSKPFLTEFINIYRANPCLWRVKSKEYSNKNLRNAAYDRLVKYCQLAFPDANRDFVAKKIQSIRGSFRKELHKMRDCKKNNEVHNPSLWYYDLLLFTLDSENYTSNMNFPYVHCELQEGDCGGEDEECSITDPPLDEVVNVKVESRDSVSEPRSPSIPTESPVPHQSSLVTQSGGKKRKGLLENEVEYMKAYYAKSLAAPSFPQIEEFEAVGIIVARKLQRMDPIQALFAEALVNKILQKGILNTLTERTIIRELPD